MKQVSNNNEAIQSRHKETTNKVARTANHKKGVGKFGFPLHRFSQPI
jgi:hypothetical protein